MGVMDTNLVLGASTWACTTPSSCTTSDLDSSLVMEYGTTFAAQDTVRAARGHSGGPVRPTRKQQRLQRRGHSLPFGLLRGPAGTTDRFSTRSGLRWLQLICLLTAFEGV